jgi:hypothetical protein
MKEIQYTILFCVCKNFCDSIFLRLRFRNTDYTDVNLLIALLCLESIQ